MAREYARIKISIADDEDVEGLSVDAQWLYFRVLIPDPTLNTAGVADWRPKRLIGKAADMDMGRLLAAAAELEAANYVLFDLDTEEVLVRTYIRSDRLLANPKSALGMVRAYRAIASKTLRSAVVSEVRRERKDNPDHAAWTSKLSREQVVELAERTALQPGQYEPVYGDLIADHIGNRNGNHIAYRNGDPIGDAEPTGSPIASGIGFPKALSPKPEAEEQGVTEQGNVTRAASPNPATPPPPRCPEHLTEPAPGPCGPCGDARRAHDRWNDQNADRLRRQATDQRRTEREHQAAARRTAIDACTLCNDDGYRGNRVCDHIDRTHTAARGIARVRAALEKDPTHTTTETSEPPADEPPAPDTEA
ncbi:hypothetical protein FK268_12775 [Tsukamurella sputi]|uniref:Helix-turn-helix DNA binding domain protein n=1 Tax=Tsukamurella sputi TaxID=2591848 RepID=A0A5C5RJS3_9ACTN|nr:hypothetical protein [Tsukamurella sputi]TWS23187.1 hypothetical protein FK268_12775 [Tsukamurella sputi]